MPDSFYAWLPICGFAALVATIPIMVGLGAYFVIRNARRLTQVVHMSWKEFARVDGLAFEKLVGSAYPRISGSYRDWPITISIYSHAMFTGRGASRVWYTQVTTPAKMPANARFKIEERGPFDRTLVGQEIALGSPEFKAKYRVTGGPLELILASLNSEVQSASLSTDMKILILENSRLTLLASGFEHRSEVLTALLDLACITTESVEQWSPGGFSKSGTTEY